MENSMRGRALIMNMRMCVASCNESRLMEDEGKDLHVLIFGPTPLSLFLLLQFHNRLHFKDEATMVRKLGWTQGFNTRNGKSMFKYCQRSHLPDL